MRQMSIEKAAEFVPVNFLPAKVECERRADCVITLRSPKPLRNYPGRIGEHLERRAKERPKTVFLAQRDGAGWRKLTYAKAQILVHAIATNLLGRNLSAARPVAILSENSMRRYTDKSVPQGVASQLGNTPKGIITNE
jgi:feruloyl-CoA synthase